MPSRSRRARYRLISKSASSISVNRCPDGVSTASACARLGLSVPQLPVARGKSPQFHLTTRFTTQFANLVYEEKRHGNGRCRMVGWDNWTCHHGTLPELRWMLWRTAIQADGAGCLVGAVRPHSHQETGTAAGWYRFFCYLVTKRVTALAGNQASQSGCLPAGACSLAQANRWSGDRGV